MTKKSPWIETLKALAIIGVVFIHVATPILELFGEIPDHHWHIGNLFDGLSRFSIPIFFMVSGALLLNRPYPLKVYLKKRFLRILPPFIFWSIIYTIYNTRVVGTKDFSPIAYFKKIIRDIFYGSEFHLWFVYVLIGLYIFLPILSKWVRHSGKKELEFFLIIWLITLIFKIPALDGYLPQIYLVNFSGYVGFLVLGYYLLKYDFKRSLPPYLITTGSIITLMGTFLLSSKNGDFNHYFYGYLSINVMVTSIGIFLLFKNYDFKSALLEKVICFLSDHSYGIYLNHILILILLNKLGINWRLFNPIFSVPLVTVLCLFISSIIVYGLRQIKLFTYISG